MASARLVKPPSRAATPDGSDGSRLARGVAFDADRSMTASPTPPSPPGPSQRSSPHPRIDILSHQVDLVVCPSNKKLSSKWNDITKRIHGSAGPRLRATLDDQYPHGIREPPSNLQDTDEVNSPLKAFFGTVKHTESFDMSNCDWLAHSFYPSYSVASNVESDDTEAYSYSQIGIRNNRKYNSIVLALKRAHKVAVENRSRMFTVAIPQVQHDGGQITPRDDAILTLSALVNFFNHPIWGARRYNSIFRVDIVIEPGLAGDAYIDAYDFGWFAMRMHLEERAGTPDPKNGFLGKQYPTEHPQLPIINSNASHYSMTTRHSVDMGRLPSFMVPVNSESEQAEASYDKAAHTTENSSDPDIPQKAAGLDISYAGLVPALGTKKTVYETDTELNAKKRIDTSTLPALVYGNEQPRLSSDLPSDAKRVQGYRSPCPLSESPLRRGRPEVPEIEARGQFIPVVSDAHSPSPTSVSSYTLNEEFYNVSYSASRYTLVPALTIEITPPIVDLPRKKSPPPILEPSHLQSPVETYLKKSKRLADSRASYDEPMIMETPTTPNAMSISAGVQSAHSSPVELSVDCVFDNEDFATVVPFAFSDKPNEDNDSGKKLVISQPAPVRPRGLMRELRVLNELSEGLDGPYWRSRSVRKRKRSAPETGFTSVN